MTSERFYASICASHKATPAHQIYWRAFSCRMMSDGHRLIITTCVRCFCAELEVFSYTPQYMKLLYLLKASVQEHSVLHACAWVCGHVTRHIKEHNPTKLIHTSGTRGSIIKRASPNPAIFWAVGCVLKFIHNVLCALLIAMSHLMLKETIQQIHQPHHKLVVQFCTLYKSCWFPQPHSICCPPSHIPTWRHWWFIELKPCAVHALLHKSQEDTSFSVYK